jgi:hypothetical protein
MPLDKLLHHFGYGKIEKMKVSKPLQKGQLNRTKLSPQTVQQPPQDEGRVNFFPQVKGGVNSFTKTNMALQFPPLTT